MKKILFYTLLAVLNFGCNAFHNPMFMAMEVPDGPPEFKAGWHDGCQSGLGTKKSSNSSVYYANFGSGIYQHDPVYQRAWSSAFYTCYVIGGRATANNIFALSPAD
jgi:hypothetical protein